MGRRALYALLLIFYIAAEEFVMKPSIERMPEVGDIVRVACFVTEQVCIGTLFEKYYRQGDANPCYKVLWGSSGCPMYYKINGYLYSVNMLKFVDRYELYRDGVKY